MLQVVEVGIHRSSWGKHCLLLPGSVSFCCLTHFDSGTLRQIPLGWLVETTGRVFEQHVLRAVQDLLHFFIPTRGMSSGQKHFSPGTSCSSSNSIPLLQTLPPSTWRWKLVSSILKEKTAFWKLVVDLSLYCTSYPIVSDQKVQMKERWQRPDQFFSYQTLQV